MQGSGPKYIVVLYLVPVANLSLSLNPDLLWSKTDSGVNSLGCKLNRGLNLTKFAIF